MEVDSWLAQVEKRWLEQDVKLKNSTICMASCLKSCFISLFCRRGLFTTWIIEAGLGWLLIPLPRLKQNSASKLWEMERMRVNTIRVISTHLKFLRQESYNFCDTRTDNELDTSTQDNYYFDDERQYHIHCICSQNFGRNLKTITRHWSFVIEISFNKDRTKPSLLNEFLYAG